MADFRGNPFIFTTADVVANFNDPTKSYKHRVKVIGIVFDGYSTDADYAELFDVAGRLIARLDGASDLQAVAPLNWEGSWINGVRVGTLTAGEVRVIIE